MGAQGPTPSRLGWLGEWGDELHRWYGGHDHAVAGADDDHRDGDDHGESRQSQSGRRYLQLCGTRDNPEQHRRREHRQQHRHSEPGHADCAGRPGFEFASSALRHRLQDKTDQIRLFDRQLAERRQHVVRAHHHRHFRPVKNGEEAVENPAHPETACVLRTRPPE